LLWFPDQINLLEGGLTMFRLGPSFILTALALLMIVLVACATPTTPAPTPTAPVFPTAAPMPTLAPTRTPTAAPEPTPTATLAPTVTPTPGPIVITDALERTVRFDKPPQRIVLNGRAFFMVLNALYFFPDAPRRVVGMPDITQSRNDFYPLVDTFLAQKKFFQGNEAGPEQIVPAQPDVVLMKSTNVKIGQALEQVKIPVVYVDLETPEQYTRDLAILGQLMGNPEQAKRIDAYYKAQIERVTAPIKNLKETDKPRVLLLQYSERGGTVAFSVPPAAWMQTRLVEMAGGRAVWKDQPATGWTTVNLEQIAAWNPEVIFIVFYGGNSREAVAKIKADARWQALQAVKENKIYGFPGDFYAWDQPDTRWGLGLVWLATRLHPTLFRDVNIQQEIIKFYALYGFDQAAVQSKVMPLLTGDWQ
jgi:iron complex transport system substrate-binding protein